MTLRLSRAAGLALAGALALTPLSVTSAQASPPPAPQTSEPDTSWFKDPLTKKQRRALVAVPSRPHLVPGSPRVRATRALYTARDGSLAVPARRAVGHDLVVGQALTFTGSALFAQGAHD